MSTATQYRGRFAPSPTGPLHFGSLVSALASYLDARKNRGQWLLRIDDIDPPREQPGAIPVILRQLEQHGLHWDETELYQSTRSAAYREILAALTGQGLLFPCTCSRQLLAKSNGIHSGPCRASDASPHQAHALRIAVTADEPVVFEDVFQGRQSRNLKREVGDFVLLRRDGLFAYQLAVVADEAYQNITHVIRGADLLDSTARQIYLQRVLDYPSPDYGHIPVATGTDGEKLSKQNFAGSLDDGVPVENLLNALSWMGYSVDAELLTTSAEEILDWAVCRWNRNLLVGDKKRFAIS